MAIESTNYVNGSQAAYQPLVIKDAQSTGISLPKAQLAKAGTSAQVTLEQGLVELTKAITQMVMQLSQLLQAFLKQFSGQSSTQEATSATEISSTAQSPSQSVTATEAAASNSPQTTATAETKEGDKVAQFLDKVQKFIEEFNDKFGSIVTELGATILGGKKLKAAIKGLQKLFKGLGKLKGVKNLAKKVKDSFKKIF